jgi:cyanophycinase
LLVASLRVFADGPPPGNIESVERPTRGSLVICGGGPMPKSVVDRFLELAGGARARIVVIPTAVSDNGLRNAVASLDLWKARGVASVQLLHTRSRDEANDPEFSLVLREATGVWVGGGDQLRLSQSYVDTEVERQLKALVARGGVIGGTSAGAAIMTRVMIAGGRTEATVGRGFDLLPGSVIDQHFLKRNRMGRLLGLLAAHPSLVGFGIDEGTALVLRGDRLSVVGDSYVVACMPASPDRLTRLQILKPGDQLTPPWLQGPADVGMSAPALASSAETPDVAGSTR